MKKIISICVIFLNLCNLCYTQDFHLSQYDATPLYLNPAMTGMFKGYYRVHAHYRNQWASVASPFVTTAISYDMPYKKVGLGALIINNRAGVGNYNVLKFVASGAYDITVDAEKQHHLSFGAQLGFIHKSVNMDKLLFRNQYLSANGIGFDPGLPSGEILENTSIFLPELNVGLVYYLSNDKAIVNPFAGFSVFHLTQPNESFFNNDNKIPRRYVMHGGAKINITSIIQITPQMLYMSQLNAREITMGLVGNYYFKSQDIWAFGGATYRTFHLKEFSTGDAIIALVGIKYGRYVYRFSYDINTSSLSNISRGKGGFELSITYLGGKLLPDPKPHCPRL